MQKKGNKKKGKKPAYRVEQAPVAKGAIMTNPRYKFGSTANGVIISHREYLAPVAPTSTAFSTNYYPLNIGDHTTFPWLSGMARNFSAYRFLSARARYVSEAPTSTAGIVMIAYTADAGDLSNAPGTKSDMLEFANSLRCAPWENAQVSLDLTKTEKYVRIGNKYGFTASTSQPALDIRTVADGLLWVGTSGISAATVGDVFLEYTVELMNPIGATPVVIGQAQCTTLATDLFQNAGVTNLVASQYNIVFGSGSVAFSTVGQVMVTITYTASATATMAALTVDSGTTIWAACNSLKTTGDFHSTYALTLSCTGLTTISSGVITNLATSVTKVSITPYLSSQVGVTAFP